MVGLYDNDYVPTGFSKDGQTPTLAELIKDAIQAALLEVRTWQPAVIVTVKPGGNHVDIQPLLMQQFTLAPIPLPLPIIQDVMVVSPRGSTYGMKLPIKVGDTGIALFAERSLDTWAVSPGPVPVDPLDTRHHDLSDAVFMPGLYPFTQPFLPTQVGVNPLDLVIYNGLSQFFLQATGGFKLSNGTPANEVLSILLRSLTQLQTGFAALGTATTQTMLGPEPLSAAPQFTTIAGALTTLIGLLTPLVGV